MPDQFAVIQGDALSVDVTLRDQAGVIINSAYPGGYYAGTEPLTVGVWPGGVAAESFAGTAVWVSAADGTIRVSLTAVQTAGLTPGTYQLRTEIDDHGVTVDAYNAVILVKPEPGGLPPALPATIVTVADAAANVPGFTGLTTTTQMALVQGITSLLNSYCQRVFPLTSHDEVHSPGRERVVRLKQYPVVTISRVCTGLAVGLTVTNTTLTRPTVSLAPSTLASDPAAVPTGLVLAGYTGGVAVAPTTLSLATYPTLATLAAAINAAGSGWAATIGNSTFADLLSTDLNEDWGSRSAANGGAHLKIYSHEVSDWQADYLAGDIRITDRYFLDGCYPEYWLGYGGYGYGRRHRHPEARVRYSAGYNADPTAGPVTMPGSLQQAAYILIQTVFQKTAVGMKLSEKTLVQSMQYGYAKDLMSIVSDLVEPFRRKRIC